MSTNPFDDEDSEFSALIDDEERYSLWPTFAGEPSGATIVHGPGSLRSALDHVETDWTDTRPRSLVEQRERDAQEAAAAA